MEAAVEFAKASDFPPEEQIYDFVFTKRNGK
jgi:hypothetical protein